MASLDGLVTMRAQPLHIGHIRLIDTALKQCNRLFIILGSTQEFGTSRNPFTFSERKKMIKTYYRQEDDLAWKGAADLAWNNIIVIGLADIFSLRWPSYVLQAIKTEAGDANLGYVFGGSSYDCDWFKDYDLTPVVVNRSDTNFSFASGSMIRDMLTYKDPRWKNYIPQCNWNIVAKKFNRLDML